MTGTVYALTTPQGTPFYVGITVQSLPTRVGQHLRDAKAGRRTSPVHELLAVTRRTGYWVLESHVPRDLLGRRERRHKRALASAGFDMLNYHHGANGCLHQPEKVRRRISRYARERARDTSGRFLPVPDPDAIAFMIAPLEAF